MLSRVGEGKSRAAARNVATNGKHEPRGAWIALIIFGAFTAVALAGFAIFGRHPRLLAPYPELISFYSISFRFFAQAHIVLGAAVLIYYLCKTARLGWIPAFGLVYLASLAAELVGTTTGWPFGAYSYGTLLGPKWLGHVPILIPVSWFLMAVPAYVLGRYGFRSRVVAGLIAGAALLSAWDLALDPAMSRLTSYWSWEQTGIYYGMPLVNLAGWLFTGTVIMLLIHQAGGRRWGEHLSIRWLAAYYVITLAMPMGMLAAAAMWPAVIVCGTVVTALLAFVLRRPPRANESPSGDPPGRRDGDVRTAKPRDGEAFERVAPHPADADAFVRYRAAEGEDERTYFRRHSKSFSFAARWFGVEMSGMVAGFYAFCRTTDDLIDREPDDDPSVVQARLDAWRGLVERAYTDGASGIDWLDRTLTSAAERGVPLSLAHELIEGVRSDAGRVRIQSWEELERYMYQVASVVGIWMCHLFDVSDSRSLHRAAALGKAMQLTNILRDVGEDLQQDRVYLPADVLKRYGLDVHDLRQMKADGAIPAAYRALMHELIGRADALYEFAAPGFADLPPKFARGSAVAATVYRGIHREIRRNGHDNLRRRAVTTLPRKLLLTMQGLSHLARIRREQAATRIGAGELARNVIGAAAIFILLTFGSVARAASPCPAIESVRDGYLEAVEDEQVLSETLEAIKSCPATPHQAYSAALVILQAKHALWPHKKLRYVRRGLDELDGLVRAHPADVEVRYLRLLSCYYLPSFFGRAWSVKEDREVLRNLLPEARDEFAPDLFEHMARFVEEAA